MNTSMMETAETVEAGHLELGAEYNMGLDITSTVFLEDIGETGFLHRLGIIVAPSLDLGIFYLRPEIGVELAGRIHGELGYAPIIGLGAGFEF